jgi:hypothetical protein
VHVAQYLVPSVGWVQSVGQQQIEFRLVVGTPTKATVRVALCNRTLSAGTEQERARSPAPAPTPTRCPIANGGVNPKIILPPYRLMRRVCTSREIFSTVRTGALPAAAAAAAARTESDRREATCALALSLAGSIGVARACA